MLEKSCRIRLLAEVRCASRAELGSREGGSKWHSAQWGPFLTSLQRGCSVGRREQGWRCREGLGFCLIPVHMACQQQVPALEAVALGP